MANNSNAQSLDIDENILKSVKSKWGICSQSHF